MSWNEYIVTVNGVEQLITATSEFNAMVIATGAVIPSAYTAEAAKLHLRHEYALEVSVQRIG